jgi:hypothetical protein
VLADIVADIQFFDRTVTIFELFKDFFKKVVKLRLSELR